MKIIDNFIDQESFDILQKTMIGDDNQFAWYHSHYKNFKGKINIHLLKINIFLYKRKSFEMVKDIFPFTYSFCLRHISRVISAKKKRK